MKHIALLLLALATTTVAAAKTYTHDFGTIKEDGGVVKYRFVLTAAKRTYAITHAFPGCPCIKAEYPKSAVKPGQRLAVTVSYDPANQSRHFTKSVYLYRSDNQRDTLMVTGTVKRTRPTVDKEKYPYAFGLGLRLKTDGVNVGTLRPGRMKVVTFDINNSYEAGMHLDISATGRDASMINIPAGLILSPKQEGKFKIVVSVPSNAKAGKIDATLRAIVNGKEIDPIPLKGTIAR